MLKSASISGMPHEELPMNCFHSHAFLDSVIQFMREDSHFIGVFRQCGQHNLLTNLGVIFLHPVTSMPPCANVYDAASSLKKWLRALPVPLISPWIVNTHLNTANPDSVRVCLSELSVPARCTFAQICLVVDAVVAKTEENQMTFANLSFCFFDNITHNSKDLRAPFPFIYFYQNAMLLLNENQTDFDLECPIPRRGVPFDPSQVAATSSLVRMRAMIDAQG
jgi:hypothetical protein